MTGTLVVDASFVMALLTNSDDAMTTWARGQMDGADLALGERLEVFDVTDRYLGGVSLVERN